jgi:hypothetical protein
MMTSSTRTSWYVLWEDAVLALIFFVGGIVADDWNWGWVGHAAGCWLLGLLQRFTS